MFWITFDYKARGHVKQVKAKIDGLKVERWWGKHKLPDVVLQKEYLYSELIKLCW